MKRKIFKKFMIKKNKNMKLLTNKLKKIKLIEIFLYTKHFFL